MSLTWTGDRNLTFEHYFEDLDEILRVLQMPRSGWAVIEKEPDAAGRTRRRLARWRGFMLIFTHNDTDGRGSNFVRYSLESRKLEIGLAVGFFGENLEYVKGTTPPPSENAAHTQYDIVTRKWRAPNALPTLTAGRADAHYNLSSVFA